MTSWTDEQRKAIDSRNSNLLVAAAAGSGKTAVLVERIIQLILKDKVDIDKLLIVTFTNAAAGEMRERIGNALLKEIDKRNENEDHLRKQVNLLNRASISTLHSFCIDVLRRFFHMINIDPNFRIGDTTETAIMKMEILEEAFEDAYGSEDSHFLGLVECFGGNKEDGPLQDLVLKLYEFIQSKPYPLQWLQEKMEDFNLKSEEYFNHPWFENIINQIKMQLSAADELLNQAKKLCMLPGGPTGYLAAIGEDIGLVEHLRKLLNDKLEGFYEAMTGIKHKRLGRLSGETDEALSEEVKALRQQAKDIIKDIKENILVKSPGEMIQDLHELYPYMVYLYKLVSEYDRCYQEKKLEKGIVDFNDLEHYALAVLENEEVAGEYRKKYAYIFVDEYQDSNIVQETILNCIKRENNLFMVGDVKQSIYRFRLADPSLFIEKYETFEDSDYAVNRRINLSKNFRSRDEIIHGVNYIFKHLMSKSFGEIDYDRNAALYKGMDSMPIKDSAIELNIIENRYETEDMDEAVEELIDMEAEARFIAGRIKKFLDKEIYDSHKNLYRKTTYRDMVILLRTTKNWSQIFSEVLIREGIPVYADVNTGYFETIEVNIFLNLLKIIDNKRQDIPLLSVMRSPIGGFSMEELIQIRIHSSSSTFYDAVMDYLTSGQELLKEKLENFFQKLHDWKEKSRYIQVDELIWKIFSDSGYYYYVGAMPGGLQRQGNLRVLVDRARQFQATSIRGLFNFVKFIEKLKNSSGDMGTAKTLAENENVVRIMSIHKSKGLEFPVVIAAGLGKQFNLMDINAQVLFHKDLGVGPKYADPILRQYTDTIAKIAMKNKIKLETLSEEMRILYVALTRAKDKLVLVGSVKDLPKAGEKWSRTVNSNHLIKGKNFLDWLCPILLRHKDAANLREWVGAAAENFELYEDESKWEIHRSLKSDITKDEKEKAITRLNLRKMLEDFEQDQGEDFSFVNQRLSWQYPHREATIIPSKLSVTDIKKLSEKQLAQMDINIPPLVKMPRFMEGKKQFSAMEKGIIMHFVMQHLDLKDVDTQGAIEGQVARMVMNELIKSEEAEAVDVLKILTFFESPIGRRIKDSEKVFREIPFNLTKSAREIIPNLKGCNDELLVQGIIDCYFEEEEGYVLVDYKTDFVTANQKQNVIDKYRIQINLYKQALENITGKRVKESFLYLFHLNEGVRL